MVMSAEALEKRRGELEAELGEPVTLDGLTASFRIFQRKRGHRHSTDDVLTAWYALSEVARDATDPPSLDFVDLGTGIGTVGLMVLSGLGPASRMTGIEAQDISFRLLRENVQANEVGSRVTVRHGDLRHVATPGRFPLVTGSPPYFDVSAGVVPSDTQKAHARFELRGTVRDYARAARALLTEDGVFVYCFPWQQKARGEEGARAEGFSLVRQRDVVPRAGLAPLFSVFVARPGRHAETTEPPLVVRDEHGHHTEAMHAVRARFGFAPQLPRPRG